MASPLQPSDLPMSSGSPSIDSPSSPILTPDSPDKVVDSIPTQEEVVELQAVAKDFPNLMKFSSTPAMLDLCITDALMPSPRFMQKMTQDEHISSPPSSIQFADELLLQAGTHILHVSESQQPVQQTIVTETIAPKAADSSLQIGNSPQIPTLPKGAWALPLKSSSFSGFQKAEMNHSVLSTNEHWPTLSKHQPKRNQHPPLAPSLSLKLGEKPIDVRIPASPVFKASQEYPWAAKMKSICNLRRVTTPVFMEDGTPKVSIPSHVLLEGLENKKEFVVGQFFRCAAPSGGHIHGVVSRIWGRKCRISARKLGESSYLFHIPDEATRKWVIQRGLWHVDDCLMFVSAWSPSPTISLPEISTIPVWLTLKNIPYQLYSIKGIDWIASAIGEPMLTSKPWLDPTQIGEAKILVEVKLDKQFPLKVALEDESGSITMVDVVYSWMPSKCSSCGQLGHKSSYCLGLGLQSVPIAGKVDGDLSCSEPVIGSVLTTEPAANLNANTSSSTVTNADLVSVLVNSTTPISHVLPSAGLNASISLRPEIILGSSSPTNLVSAPDSTTNDVETLTSSLPRSPLLLKL